MSQSQMWTGFAATLVIAIILGAYTALEPARMENARVRMEELNILAASRLYTEYCAACHGAQGDGFQDNPSLDNDELRNMDTPSLTRIIARGSGDLMPPASASEGGVLTHLQVDQLVLMIRSGAWEQVRARVNLSGSQALYVDNCAGCHGPNGEGSNFGPRLNTRKVRERMTPEQLTEMIQNGSGDGEMPSFAQDLSSADLAELVNLLRNWEDLVENQD